MDTNKQRFYWKGRYFEKEEEFWNFICQFPLDETTEEDFFREWNNLGMDIWTNVQIRKMTLTNAELNKVLVDNFLHLYKKIFEDK